MPCGAGRRRAYEHSADAVQRWLWREYPAIAARAKQEKGTIIWGDETGLRSDDVRGRSYAPRGTTPVVVRPNHRRAGLGLISALTNKGELRWMMLDGAIKAPTLIRFLQDWLAERRAETEVFHLPAHSPELNADEGLNADLKQAITRKPPARSKDDLKRTLISSHMRSLSNRPDRIHSYFGHHTYRYAA